MSDIHTTINQPSKIVCTIPGINFSTTERQYKPLMAHEYKQEKKHLLLKNQKEKHIAKENSQLFVSLANKSAIRKGYLLGNEPPIVKTPPKRPFINRIRCSIQALNNFSEPISEVDFGIKRKQVLKESDFYSKECQESIQAIKENIKDNQSDKDNSDDDIESNFQSEFPDTLRTLGSQINNKLQMKKVESFDTAYKPRRLYKEHSKSNSNNIVPQRQTLNYNNYKDTSFKPKYKMPSCSVDPNKYSFLSVCNKDNIDKDDLDIPAYPKLSSVSTPKNIIKSVKQLLLDKICSKSKKMNIISKKNTMMDFSGRRISNKYGEISEFDNFDNNINSENSCYKSQTARPRIFRDNRDNEEQKSPKSSKPNEIYLQTKLMKQKEKCETPHFKDRINKSIEDIEEFKQKINNPQQNLQTIFSYICDNNVIKAENPMLKNKYSELSCIKMNDFRLTDQIDPNSLEKQVEKKQKQAEANEEYFSRMLDKSKYLQNKKQKKLEYQKKKFERHYEQKRYYDINWAKRQKSMAEDPEWSDWRNEIKKYDYTEFVKQEKFVPQTKKQHKEQEKYWSQHLCDVQHSNSIKNKRDFSKTANYFDFESIKNTQDDYIVVTKKGIKMSIKALDKKQSETPLTYNASMIMGDDFIYKIEDGLPTNGKSERTIINKKLDKQRNTALTPSTFYLPKTIGSKSQGKIDYIGAKTTENMKNKASLTKYDFLSTIGKFDLTNIQKPSFNSLKNTKRTLNTDCTENIMPFTDR